MKRRYFSILFLIFIAAARVLVSDKSIDAMKSLLAGGGAEAKKDMPTVVIDPGHGGRDPGKVGVNGALEKDINLAIALKLKNLLEQNDVRVIMTRTEDTGLYSENDSNKKKSDLDKRIDIINSSGALFAVSIHQNSFSQSGVKGAQVFYHSQSEQGRKLAEILQKQLIETIDDGNRRKAKSNTSYYLLKHTTCPLVIVECGYLSNHREAELLLDEEYQEKMAWAIHLGIMQWISMN
ncbi:MAG: N-acetylmuramoyl-L-alanine amidase [Clostridiales bacterium]|nr:N-acetylmuramoyl-L-alanine amidase [Clostridiales bacterium]